MRHLWVVVVWLQAPHSHLVAVHAAGADFVICILWLVRGPQDAGAVQAQQPCGRGGKPQVCAAGDKCVRWPKAACHGAAMDAQRIARAVFQ